MNPKLLTTPFAQDGIKNNIPESNAPETQNATMQYGFPDVTQRKISEGGIPPERADFNGILNEITQNVVHQNKGLGYEFDEEYANKIGGYPIHAELMLSNGRYVKAVEPSRTNNPNVDISGWVYIDDASQIKDVDGKTQQYINNVFKETRLWVEMFAEGDDLTVDAGHAFRRAISYAETNGFETVWFRGNYKITSIDPRKWVAPYDDGSLPASLIPSDVHGVLPPEDTTEFNVHLWLPANMAIRAENSRENSLRFDWDRVSGGIDASQTIGIVQTCLDWDGTFATPTVAGVNNRYTRFVRGCFDGFTVRNAFVGILSDGVRQFDDWKSMRFLDCGIAAISAGSDSCAYGLTQIQYCYAGMVSGGWWQQRAASGSATFMPQYSESILPIGWTDSVEMTKVEYFFSTDGDADRFQAIDQFFDTYFWKTQNNATRLSTTTNGTTPSTGSIIPYTGVASRALWRCPRQKRTGYNNDIIQLKVYGSLKPPIASYEKTNSISNYLERVGQLNRTPSGNVNDDANDYFKSTYNVLYTIDYLPACVVEQLNLTTAGTSLASSASNRSLHHTRLAPTVGTPYGVDVSTMDFNGCLRASMFAKEVNLASQVINITYWTGPSGESSGTQTVLYQADGRNLYSRGALSFSNTPSNYAASKEIGFKTLSYPSDKVNPDGKVRGFLGAVGSEFETNGAVSWTRQQNQTIVYIDFEITDAMRTNSELRVYLQDYAANPLPPTSNQAFGVEVPKIEIVRLPPLVDPNVFPKSAALSNAGSSKGFFFTMFSDFNTSTAIRGNAFSAAGYIRLKLTYRSARWD